MPSVRPGAGRKGRGGARQTLGDPRLEGAVIYTQIRKVPKQIVDGLGRCGVAAITDTMGPVLAPQQLMIPDMKRRTTRKSVAGQCVTVAGALADNLMMHAALQVIMPGNVLVVAAAHSLGAQWGDTVTHAAMVHELAAVIVDGAVRDLDRIEELGFPIWSTDVNPLAARKSTLGWVNRPITCAGVHIEPGDIVVADGDGVVVVPAVAAAGVFESASKLVHKEGKVRLAAARGVMPGEHSGLYKYLDDQGIRRVRGNWMKD